MDISFDLGREPAEPEAPFHILALGHFGGRAPASAAPVAVAADTLDDAMAARDVGLDLAVPNHLGSRPATLELQISLHTLGDFTPAALLAAVPALAAARALREGLVTGAPDLPRRLAACEQAGGMDGLVAAARRAATPTSPTSPAAPPAEPAAEAGSALDRILGMVDAGAAAAAPDRAPSPGGAADTVTALLARQVAAILHDPAFAALEAAWRGLRFLLSHLDPRSGAGVSVLDLPREQWASALEPGGAAERGEAGPPALIVADLAVTHATADLDLLQALAEGAEGLQAPLLAAVTPGFFGVAGAEAGSLPFLGTVLDRPAYDRWNAFRDKPCARWAGLAFNGFLLRAPYGTDDRKAAGLAEPAPDPAAHLWGNPAWAVAAVAGRSLARTGWPTELTGPEDGALAGLDLWTTAPKAGPEAQIPLEAALSDTVVADLAEAGLIPLTCRPNRDSVYVLRAPSAWRPARYGAEAPTDESRAMGRLAYQLLAARLADRLGRYRARHPDRDGAEAARGLENYLQGVVAGTGPGADARVRADAGPPAMLEVEVRTGAAVLGGATVRLTLPAEGA